jgi:hypothetical protein
VPLERGREGADDGGLHGRGPFLRRCDPGSYSTGSLDEVPNKAGAVAPSRPLFAAAPTLSAAKGRGVEGAESCA